MNYPPTAIRSLLLMLLLVSACATHQSTSNLQQKTTYLDLNSEPVDEAEYRKQWNANAVRWDHIDENNNRVASLFEPQYQYYQLSYKDFLNSLEEITGKNYPGNPTFLIEYTYKDDQCNSQNNNWSKQVISKRKAFTTPNKKQIEKRNPGVVVLNFFEEGILLRNSPGKANEYFYQDEKNFLRNTIFKDQSFCGSFAIVRPEGHTLVRNGESYALYMEQFLDTNNWSVTSNKASAK